MRPGGETASDYFGELVASYDSLIRRAVPRYAEMTERLVTYLPARARRVLELGCGTGNLTLSLAARFPKAEITCVDAAPEMLAVTRARLAVTRAQTGALDPAALGRIRFVCARFEDLALAPADYDLATSCIALHHVADKASFYGRLHVALAPDGGFCFADQLAGGSEANHDINWQSWLAFCRRPGHCDEAEVQSLLAHAAAHDHYTSLAEHLRLLASAGFGALDCVWRNWMWGIVTAKRC